MLNLPVPPRCLVLLVLLVLPFDSVALADEAWPWTVRVLGNADSRAELAPCDCAGPPVSGLALRTMFFKRVRAGRSDVLVLDGGDFSPPGDVEHGPRLASLMIEAMSLMGYDAVGVGELDLLRGFDHLRAAATSLPLVCANLQLAPGGPEIPPLRWVAFDGRRAAVTSFLDPVLFYELPGALEVDPDSLLVTDPARGLRDAMASVGDSADLVVVLAHGSAEMLEDVLPAGIPCDVVLFGHEHEKETRLGNQGPVLLLRPGPLSQAVADLEISFAAPHEAERANYRLLELKLQTRGDTRVDALVKAFEANPDGS
jgi:2',3'-cyclic-nucleotide 2'-phosphodiesterase (5'-nucleotidase family)